MLRSSKSNDESLYRTQGGSVRPGETQAIRVVDHNHVKVPRLGVICHHRSNRQLRRMINHGRAHVYSATFRFEQGRWWLVLSGVAATFHPARTSRKQRHRRPAGLDVGVRSLAVCADDMDHPVKRWEGVNALESALSDLRRAHRRLARTKPDSAGRRKKARRLGRIHAPVAHVRHETLHQLTHWAATQLTEVTIEDLDVFGLLANGRLARRLSDSALAMLRWQLTYKARWYGTILHEADRWYPSSKTCAACGSIHRDLALRDITWTCPNPRCRAIHDRDHSAAVNLARWAQRCPPSARMIA